MVMLKMVKGISIQRAAKMSGDCIIKAQLARVCSNFFETFIQFRNVILLHAMAQISHSILLAERWWQCSIFIFMCELFRRLQSQFSCAWLFCRAIVNFVQIKRCEETTPILCVLWAQVESVRLKAKSVAMKCSQFNHAFKSILRCTWLPIRTHT